MDKSWGKFYAKTFEGSMYGAGSTVFAVWAYCIAKARPPTGTVELNPKALTNIIGESEPKVIEAIDYLLKPDPNSRTPAEAGRRLLKTGQFEYKLVNFEIHRAGIDDEERRRYFRDRQRIYRKRVKQNVFDSISTITQAEAEAEAEAEGEGKPPPSLSEQIRKDRSFGKCCTLCGSGSRADSGKMIWRESLPWCQTRCYDSWVKSGRPKNS